MPNENQNQPAVIRNEIDESGKPADSWGKRIFKSIVIGTKADVVETILLGVIPNAITNFVSEGISATFGVLLYGKDWYTKNRGMFGIGFGRNAISSSGTRFMNPGRTDYHSQNQAARSGGYVAGPTKNANGYLFSNIKFYDGDWPMPDGTTQWLSGMAKAGLVRAALLDTIERYHEVSVEAFYAEAHAPARDQDYMDGNWVWKNLDNVRCFIHDDGGVSLELPDPVFSKR